MAHTCNAARRQKYSYSSTSTLKTLECSENRTKGAFYILRQYTEYLSKALLGSSTASFIIGTSKKNKITGK
jgi:hypothetical protein